MPLTKHDIYERLPAGLPMGSLVVEQRVDGQVAHVALYAPLPPDVTIPQRIDDVEVTVAVAGDRRFPC